MENTEQNQECSNKKPHDIRSNPELNCFVNKIDNDVKDIDKSFENSEAQDPLDTTIQHNPEEMPEKMKRHKCDRCEKTFVHSHHLKRHVASVHEGQRKFNCEFCEKVFSRSDRLKRHMNIIHEGLKDDEECELCGKTFYDKKSLKKHITAVHGGEIYPGSDMGFDNKDLLMNGTEKYNPWAVGQLEDFLYFCCPECDERNQSKELFLQHAVVHPLAKETLRMLGIKMEPFDEDMYHDEYNEDYGDDSLYYPTVEYGDENVSIENMKKTKNSNAKSDKFYCGYCEKTFGRKEHLKRHVNSVHEGVKFDCNICEMSFSRKDKLKIHLKSVHGDNTKTSTKIEPGDQHNRKNESHDIEVKEEPIDENDQQMNKTQLEYQSNIKHEIKDGSHDENYVNQKRKIYNQQMKNEPKQKVVCETCGKEFTRREHLRTHIMNIHDTSPRKCKFCDETFMTSKTLKSHIREVHPEHVPEPLKKYTCDLCGNQFLRPSHLKTHIEIIHEGKRPHSCEYCGKTFGYSKGLKVHIDTVHEQLHTYKCDRCEKIFKRPQHLKRHIANVHEGQKNYNCQFCGKCFATNSSMQVHIGNTHEPDKRRHFNCEQCGKVFYSNNSLKNHVRHVHENNIHMQSHF